MYIYLYICVCVCIEFRQFVLMRFYVAFAEIVGVDDFATADHNLLNVNFEPGNEDDSKDFDEVSAAVAIAAFAPGEDGNTSRIANC
jgi:hypothetical protein